MIIKGIEGGEGEGRRGVGQEFPRVAKPWKASSK